MLLSMLKEQKREQAEQRMEAYMRGTVYGKTQNG